MDMDPADRISLAVVLQRIAGELAGCRGLLAKIESATETLIKAGHVADDDPLHIAELQNFDLLDQTLADLVLCIQDIAATPSAGKAQPLHIPPITRRMRLADLRDRLSGRPGAMARVDRVELF